MVSVGTGHNGRKGGGSCDIGRGRGGVKGVVGEVGGNGN